MHLKALREADKANDCFEYSFESLECLLRWHMSRVRKNMSIKQTESKALRGDKKVLFSSLLHLTRFTANGKAFYIGTKFDDSQENPNHSPRFQ